MKKLIAILLSLVMVAAMFAGCAGGGNDTVSTGPKGTEGTTTDPTPSETEGGDEKPDITVINVADYIDNKDAWETDGGDAYFENGAITFDNCFSGDFAAVRLTEEAQNVTYKLNIQVNEAGKVSLDDWTWWDCELLIMARSSLAAASWYDDGSQTGYTLTSWGDLSTVFIGRSGYDDAFGEYAWNINDGQPHAIELTVKNNEDNTSVTVTLVVDGVEIASVVDDGSKIKNDRPSLYPDAGGLTIRCKYLEAVVS